MTYEHHGPPPFAHQREIFERTRGLEFYALLWEMRVGKTKPSIDTAAWLFERGSIDAVLVIAPIGVHLNWARVAIPEHCPPRVRSSILEWVAARAGTKKFQTQLEGFLKHDGLAWLCANFDALITANFQEAVAQLTKWRRVLLIVDEAHNVKTPKAQRTKALLKLRSAFKYRRVLTGTPATQGPFDLWSQFNLLSPEILGPRFVPFKQRYGVFKRVRYGSGPAFDELVEYRDLDDLYRRIEPHSSRLTQADVYDLPPMISERRFFELSATQRAAFEKLREELILELESGAVITAVSALTMLLRLQQISRGFLSQNGEVHDLGAPRPALAALRGVLEQLPGKAVIWCRFRQDVEQIVAALGPEACVRYDGSVPPDWRPGWLQRFREEPARRWFVGTPATGGVGVDLSAADAVIFYSHGWDLAQRLQAIARIQGPNQKSKSLLLVDLVAAGTPDLRCLESHARKEDLAAIVTGDKLRDILKYTVAEPRGMV